MTLHLKTFQDVDAYRAAALPFLRAHATHLNQLLMACERLTQAAAQQHGYWLGCLYEGDTVIAVASCTSVLPVRDLSVSDWPPHALPLLVDALAAFPVESVVGPMAAVQAIGTLLGITRMRTLLRNYALSGAPVLPPAQGAARPFARSDMALLADWFAAFEIECHLPPRPRLALLQGFESDLQPGSARHHVFWCVEGEPVAMATLVAASAAARIGPVYTAPAARGHGYAGALVAHVASNALLRGVECVCLFADAANPTSNALYQRIGFVDKGAFAQIDRGTIDPVSIPPA